MLMRSISSSRADPGHYPALASSTLAHGFQSLQSNSTPCPGRSGAAVEPVCQFQRMREEALEPEAMDLEVRTVGQRDQ
jgi:hypothetical protein